MRLAIPLVACFLLAGLAYLNDQREALPKGGRLDAIYFENEDHGFVRACCGNPPEVYETQDGGRTWRKSNGSRPRFRRGRVFVDAQNGWSVAEDYGSRRGVYSTGDGGKTWHEVFRSSVELNFMFDAIQAVSESEVWVLGQESYHTTDGGRTWEKVPVGLISVDFLDRENGWILGNGLWKTADGGRTWRSLVFPRDPPSVKTPMEYCDLYFVDRQHGWMVAGVTEDNLEGGAQTGIVLITSDGGETWSHVSIVDHFLWSVYFLNETVGWVAGLDGVVLKTIDGGKTWFSPSRKTESSSPSAPK